MEGWRDKCSTSALPTFSRILYYNGDFPLVPSFKHAEREKKTDKVILKKKRLKEVLHRM